MMIFSLVLFVSSLLALVDAEECACSNKVSFLPPDESNLGSAENVCDNHSEDDSWFNSVHFDDTLGNAIIRYRYCEHAFSKLYTGSTCKGSLGGTYQKIKNIYDESPTCTKYYTKTIPENTNFRVFHGYEQTDDEYTDQCQLSASTWTACEANKGPSKEAVLAYSSQGTVCFRFKKDPDPCRTGTFCEGTTVGCFPWDCETKCIGLGTPGEKLDVVLLELDDDRNRFWIEVEVNPVDSSPNEAANSGGNKGGNENMAAGVVATALLMFSFAL